MPKAWLDESKLLKFVKRARERWSDFEVVKVVQKRSKQLLYVSTSGTVVKLVVYPDGRVRAFSRTKGVALAVKRVLERVLGVEYH